MVGPQVLSKFRRELDDCSENNGAVCTRSYVLAHTIAQHWVAESQEIEGIMSLIKLASTRGSSQISLALLDARVSTTKAIGVGSRDTRGFRYSDVKDALADPTYFLTQTLVADDPQNSVATEIALKFAVRGVG